MTIDDRAWVTISSEQLDKETLRKALVDNVNVVEREELAKERAFDPLAIAVLGFVIMHYADIVPVTVSAEKVFEYLKPFLRDKLKKFLAEGNDKDDGPGKTPVTVNVTVRVNSPDNDNRQIETHDTIDIEL